MLTTFVIAHDYAYDLVIMDDETTVEFKRKYRKITPATIARFNAEKALQGNGSAAVRVLEPDSIDPSSRAYKITRQGQEVDSSDYVEERLEQISEQAIDRIESVVNSTDTASALNASKFVIEQRRGKAVQRNINHNTNLNIQAVLE